MKEKDTNTIEKTELPDSWWHKVYVGVVVSTILVISALWAFSESFK